MSSIMQHRGRISNKGVGILAEKMPAGYPNNHSEGFPDGIMQPPELVFKCSKCGRDHPVLFEFFRRPRGMLGNWAVFRIDGADRAPDLSCPQRLAKLPRGSKQLPQDRAEKYWHSTD